MTKIKSKLVGITLFLFFLLAAVLGSLFFYEKAHADRIYHNISVSGIDLSGLSKTQALTLLEKYYKQNLEREITLIAGEKEIEVKFSDTGVGFDANRVVEDSYKVGHGNSLINNFIEASKTLLYERTIAAEAKINDQRFEEFLNLQAAQLNIEVIEPTLKIENGTVVETPSALGQKVLTAGLKEDIVYKILDPAADKIDLKTEKLYPKIGGSDFEPAKLEAERLLQKNITLSYENFAFRPNSEEIGVWLTLDDNNGQPAVFLDDNKIKTYLNKIASNFETQMTKRKINALDNSIILEGKEGRYLDKDDAVKKIKLEIAKDSPTIALQTYTKAAEEEKVMPAEGLVPGRFEGKYIDIDLTQQKLCLVEGQNIGNCYLVSSGKASTPTPTGTRLIQSKSERAWSNKYGLWLPWWQSMGGGYGIHELPEWPSGYKEGENHLGTPVSHGCVRLGVGPAKTVYDWSAIGTPVYIHK